MSLWSHHKLKFWLIAFCYERTIFFFLTNQWISGNSSWSIELPRVTSQRAKFEQKVTIFVEYLKVATKFCVPRHKFQNLAYIKIGQKLQCRAWEFDLKNNAACLSFQAGEPAILLSISDLRRCWKSTIYSYVCKILNDRHQQTCMRLLLLSATMMRPFKSQHIPQGRQNCPSSLPSLPKEKRGPDCATVA